MDGVMEDPGGAEQFIHGGWSYLSFNDEFFKYKHTELYACGALLLGRVTYQGFEASWPSRTDATGFAGRMNSIPKLVVSKTLKTVSWNNSRLINDDPRAEIGRLRAMPGKDILVVGSRQLVSSLVDYNLVDELRLMVHPIVLGRGRRIFESVDVKRLKLVGTDRFTTGIVLLTYKMYQ